MYLRVLSISFAFLGISTGAVVSVAPGANLAALAQSNATGTTFQIQAGTYRLQRVIPKTGQSFIGSGAVILNGSLVLTGWKASGKYWYAAAPKTKGVLQGTCDDNPQCAQDEIVYIDDQLLWAVKSTSALGAGKFYYDYSGGKVYVGQDPSGHTVELTQTLDAFDGTASNVTIQGLTVEKYANPAQTAAINGVNASGWHVLNNIVQLNHGVGIKIGSNSTATGNTVLRNGQLGIAAVGNTILFDSNEVAYNNTNGFESGWEAGGSKFALTDGLTVQNNYVHDNNGPGLWTDIDNIRTVYDSNRVINNGWNGIFHEISWDAVIKNNVVSGNGYLWDDWLWGSNILISTSSNVQVYNNTVTVTANGGNGIGLIQQDRGDGKYGDLATNNNRIYSNNVTYLGSSGLSGGVADYNASAMFAAGNNVFSANKYVMPAGATKTRFVWKGGSYTIAQMQSMAQEPGSTQTSK